MQEINREILIAKAVELLQNGTVDRVLGWQAERSIADMCRDSWNWQKNNPNGYSNEKPL